MDENLILEAITVEANKLIVRHQRYVHELHEHLARCERRSGVLQAKQIQRAAYWDWHCGFDPYHVRKHSNKIARAVWRALSRRTYAPRSAALFDLPKDGGGIREVCVFQVADQAVARTLFKRLLEKNKGRLSSRC